VPGWYVSVLMNMTLNGTASADDLVDTREVPRGEKWLGMPLYRVPPGPCMSTAEARGL